MSFNRYRSISVNDTDPCRVIDMCLRVKFDRFVLLRTIKCYVLLQILSYSIGYVVETGSVRSRICKLLTFIATSRLFCQLMLGRLFSELRTVSWLFFDILLFFTRAPATLGIESYQQIIIYHRKLLF